jgi:hypothetical protein
LTISPFASPENAYQSFAGMSAAGQKKGIFGRVRAKAGQERCGNLFGFDGAGACGTDRCYEPADVMSLLVSNSEDLDHELVI